MPSVSDDHPILPLPAPCWCPAVGAAIVPVAHPIQFPPPTVLYSIFLPPISTQCTSCDVFPDLVALPSSGNVVACFLVFWLCPQESPACVGSTLAHFCFPSRDFPQKGYSPAAFDSLQHSPLLRPPWTRSPSLSHTRPGSPPSASVPLPRSLMRMLHRTRSLMHVIPQIRCPLCQIRRHPVNLL